MTIKVIMINAIFFFFENPYGGAMSTLGDYDNDNQDTNHKKDEARVSKSRWNPTSKTLSHRSVNYCFCVFCYHAPFHQQSREYFNVMMTIRHLHKGCGKNFEIQAMKPKRISKTLFVFSAAVGPFRKKGNVKKKKTGGQEREYNRKQEELSHAFPPSWARLYYCVRERSFIVALLTVGLMACLSVCSRPLLVMTTARVPCFINQIHFGSF